MDNQGKGYWFGMSALNQLVAKAIASGTSEDPSAESLGAANELEISLPKYRSTFISLLKHPRKNASERKILQQSVSEKVALPGFTYQRKLPESFVQEALILSDMFDLSEMCAFSLLRSAEEEKTLYPNLPRGLIAILFYYDSREQLVNAFKLLVQARQGVTWTLLPSNEELSLGITRNLSQCLNISLLDRILELLANSDLTKEVDLLQKNRALGDSKHRAMVFEKFQSVNLLLAETVFCWSAQTPLKREECKRLLNYLSKVELTQTKNGSIDAVNMNLLLALLYSIDVSYLANAEDITEALSQYPITNDPKFIPEIHKEIKEGNWQSNGILATVQFAWAVSLVGLRQFSTSIQLTDHEAYLEDDETMLNLALKSNVFQFIKEKILPEENKPLDTFFLSKLHNLFVDFIYHMFDKIKIMKSKADENARHIMNNLKEGLQSPPILEQPYEDLLSCLATLYSGMSNTSIIDEYWYDAYSVTPVHGQNSKQMALYRFIRLPGDFLFPSLFVPFIDFLTSIASTPRSAQSVYNFLRMNSQPSQGANLSWDNFINALTQYFNSLRLQHPQNMNETVYRNTPKHCISPQELDALISVLKLITVVTREDESARIAICDNTQWSAIYVFVGLISCNIPLKLKAQLIQALSAFAKTSSIAGRIWQAVESASLVPAHDGTPGYSNRGIKQDIEEVESLAGEFPLSQAFLDLIQAFVKIGVPNQRSSLSHPGFKPYLNLIKNNIFLPHDSRSYKNAGERWLLSKKCLSLFHEMLLDYKPPPVNFPSNESWRHPSHMLLIDLVHDSRLIRQILCVLHDAVKILDQYLMSAVPGKSDMEDSLIIILKILLEAYRLQKNVLTKDAEGEVLIIGVDRLLLTMNARTGSCDHMRNIAQIIAHHVTIPVHAAFACKILTVIASAESGQNHLLPLLAAPPFATSFQQNFVQLLDHSNLDEFHTEAAKDALAFLKSCLYATTPNLSQFLLGFVNTGTAGNSELRHDLLEPGVRGFPRTAFHAILNALPNLNPILSESALNLIAMLATHSLTSAATLRYLSSHDFVHRSLANLAVTSTDNPYRLLCIGWILRIAALDLRYHHSHKQRSHLRRLINLLIHGGMTDSENCIDYDMSAVNRGVLLSLLEIAELNEDIPPPMQSELQSKVQNLMSECEETINGVKIFNLMHMHQLLHQLCTDPNAAIAPNEPVESEIQQILDYVLSINHAREMFHAQKHFLESWRQLTEVTVSVMPAELTEMSAHQAFLHTITLELTRRLLDDSALPELSSILVSTLLMLVTTLHSIHTYVTCNKNDKPQLPSSLQLILRGILDCMLKFKASTQSVRASLYASLLSYLRIASSTTESLPNEVIMSQKETSIEQFHRENFECVRDDLPQIVDILSCEATAGHIICRLLALLCLDAISALERRSAPMASSFVYDSILLAHLSDQGHLRRIIDGVAADDMALVNMLNEGKADLRPLYLWEARSSLLSRLSLAPNGARMLLQAGMLTKISDMQMFKYNPSEAANLFMETNEQTPIVQIYDGAVTGAIRICMAVLTSLGPKDDSAISQVMLFFSSNVDAISESIRVPKGSISGPLKQLSLMTSVIASASPPNLFSDACDPNALQTAAHTRRLRKQLLNLLPHFIPGGRLSQTVEQLPELSEEEGCLKEETRTSFLTVFYNCLIHARDYLSKPQDGITLIFQPTIEINNTKIRQLTLGTLINAMDQSALQFLKVRRLKEDAVKSLNEIETAQYDAIKKYVSSNLVASTSPSTVRKLASVHLAEVIRLHLKQEELCVHALDSSILLLYRHLDFYVGKPSDANSAAIAVTKTPAQLEELRTQLRQMVDEVLPKISHVSNLYTNEVSHVPFVESCITRIKWILAA